MGLFDTPTRSRRMRLGVAAITLAGSMALPAVGVLAQDDPCSLIAIAELEAVTGAIDTGTIPGDVFCHWTGQTVGDDIFDIELILDVGVDPAVYVGNYGATETVQVAGADGYLYAGIGVAIVAVRLASSTPLLSVSTTGDQDAAAIATELLAIAIHRLAPDDVPLPTRPSPTSTPAPTPTFAGPTPLADVSDCARRIDAADLTDPFTIDAVDECRFLDGGADVARGVLEAGGTRDQMWAAVWVYASSSGDPGPLLPMLTHGDPSIRVMAAAAVARLGEVDGLEALRAALQDDSILLGSSPPLTVSGFAVQTLWRYVSARDAPGTSPEADGVRSAADAWAAWLDRYGAALSYDPAAVAWSVP